MAPPGKRRRLSISQDKANELLRRHFEARFQPIEDVSAPNEDEDVDEDKSSQDAEWEGLSDSVESSNDNDDNKDAGVEDGPAEIEIIDHSAQTPKETAMSRREFKSFMSSRPPDDAIRKGPLAQPSPKEVSSLPEDAPSLLAQDLELRRLLAESHLLAPHAATKSLSSVSWNAAQPRSFDAGRTRQKALDLRVQALGSRVSIHKQVKMPMNMRKGMVAAEKAREAKRRREARENGIILEKQTLTEKNRRKRRQGSRDDGGGIHRPGVGRLKGAALHISDRDVRGIEGTRDVFGRRGRR